MPHRRGELPQRRRGRAARPLARTVFDSVQTARLPLSHNAGLRRWVPARQRAFRLHRHLVQVIRRGKVQGAIRRQLAST